MYSWIAAGSEPGYGCAVYVKYMKNKEYKEYSDINGFHIFLKDRYVYITRQGYREYNHLLPIGNFDFCVNLDMLGCKNSGVKHTGLMFCYEPISSANLKDNNFLNESN